MGAALPADPGGEKVNAPVGSEAWAQRLRLELQAMVKELPYYAERVKRYIDLITERSAWTLMNRADGSRFSSFDDFCQTAEPYGLGRSPTEIRAYLEARFGKHATRVMTTKPAQAVGTNRHTSSGDNITSKGTSAAYRVSVLKRDFPNIADAYAAGEFPSVAAAWRAAGLEKPRDPVAVILKLTKKLTAADRKRLRSELGW